MLTVVLLDRKGSSPNRDVLHTVQTEIKLEPEGGREGGRDYCIQSLACTAYLSELASASSNTI